MIEEIKNAAELSNSCQRNWDHSASIPDEHVETLIHCIRHAPTKQNETHYKVFYTRDPDLIYKIYRKTRQFAVTPSTGDATQFTDNNGKTALEYNVRNSQVNANLLIAFCDDWDQSKSRTMIHRIVDERPNDATSVAVAEKERQKAFSIGVATGELILAANLLGYRNGICSAFWAHEMADFFEGGELRLLIGIGRPHPNKDRKEHEEILNKDIVAVDRRSGADDDKWIFPTFEKDVMIKELL